MNADTSRLKQLEILLQEALGLADEAGAEMVAIRIAEALDLLAQDNSGHD
jgi:hypothetical protein